MSSDTPVTVAVATYNNKASAEQDYDAIRGTKHHGHLDHLAIAFVEKDADGRLRVDRHDSTAKHLAWGGGVLGASLAVISAPLGVVFLGPLAATTAVWAAVGGFVGHFHHNIPKDEVRKMIDVLETGQFGLVVVAVNPQGTNVEALLANAVATVVAVNVSDPAGALAHAFETVGC
jgi:uncharacterized membrane protein